MSKYNLNSLFPKEFEELSRDLLQKKLDVILESFTEGRDNGIDFRLAKGNVNKIVVQVKRYKEFRQLKQALKKELNKVVKLKPERYIITTSAGLTPEDKDFIFDQFQPYILEKEDILGADDLCGLLDMYKDVYWAYPNVWSITKEVLEKIAHNDMFIASEFEKENIDLTNKTYVMNESYNKALHILNENRFVIISGIPGIGKTTLARMLILRFIQDGYEQLIPICHSINEARKLYDRDKKQILYYDDFLGSVSLDNNKINDDSSIVQLIGNIKRSRNKLFILTTREYILRDGLYQSEKLNIENINIGKCILDIGTYTPTIKAKIFVNHFSQAEISISHLRNLVKPENHLPIVEHNNYNPRIIEYIVNHQIWKECEAENFGSHILTYFNNPDKVWSIAFNKLNNVERYMLMVLATMRFPVSKSILSEALKSYISKNDIQVTYDGNKFIYSLRKLEETFIKINKNQNFEEVVDFHNPSIKDFLISYLNNNKEDVKFLINGFCYREQFAHIFTYSNQTESKKVNLDNDCLDIFLHHLKNDYLSLKETGSLNSLFYTNTHSNIGYYIELYNIVDNFKHKNVLDVVTILFKRNMYLKGSSNMDKYYYNLLAKLDLRNTNFSSQKFFEQELKYFRGIDYYHSIYVLKDTKPLLFNTITQHEEFVERMVSEIDTSINSISKDDLDEYYSLLYDVLDFEKYYDVDLYYYKNRLEEYIRECEENNEDNENDDEDYDIYPRTNGLEKDQGVKEIAIIFEQLLDK